MAVAEQTSVNPHYLHSLSPFNFEVNPSQVLQGATSLGSICLDTLDGASAFVSLAFADMGAVGLNNSSATNLIGQNGRLVVIGPQPLLEAAPASNSSLTLYGNPGADYDLISSTNLVPCAHWSVVDTINLTNSFQVIDLIDATNQMQFFKALEP